MLKTLWIYAACLFSLPLTAETIGNVEFQFPPSKYDWKLFADDSFICDPFCEEDEDGEEIFDEDFENTDLLKFFTHREGDALEVFIAVQVISDEEDDDDDDEDMTLFSCQKDLDETLNQYLPNHKLVLLSLQNGDEEGFAEWELNDGVQDVMHGYSRGFSKDGVTTLLCYLTTASRTEYNRLLWTETLNQARIFE